METVTKDTARLVTARYCETANRRLKTSDERPYRNIRPECVPDETKTNVRQATGSLLMQRRHRGQASQFVDGLPVNRAGATNCDPPCTMRCPDSSEAAASRILIGPLQDIFQNFSGFEGTGQ